MTLPGTPGPAAEDVENGDRLIAKVPLHGEASLIGRGWIPDGHVTPQGLVVDMDPQDNLTRRLWN